jgi:hypothetical protein
MRFFAALPFSLLFASLAACTVPTGPIDAGPCPDDLSTSTMCSAENTQCNRPSSCVICASGRYIPYAAACTCSGGYWYCSVPDCTLTAVATFADPACTVPSGTDAGRDVVGSDASDDVNDASMDATTDVAPPDGIDANDDDSMPADGCAPRPDATAASDAGCSGGRFACSGSCVDLQSDPRNCGGCGNECLPFQICSAGVCGCECAAGLTVCTSGCNACACHDLVTDPTHCGSCTTACATGEICVGGLCVRPDAG